MLINKKIYRCQGIYTLFHTFVIYLIVCYTIINILDNRQYSWLGETSWMIFIQASTCGCKVIEIICIKRFFEHFLTIVCYIYIFTVLI